MARPQNNLTTVKVTLSLTPGVQMYLRNLVDTQLYGKNHAEAAARLIEKQLEILIEKGILKKQKF